jgi:hypothetical protein
MKRILVTLGAIVLAAAAAAQERSTAPPGAEVYFITPRAGAVVHGPFTVRFGLKGLGIAPAAPLQVTDKIRHFGKGQTETELTLPPGKHTLELLFADYQHIPFDPPLHSKKITITVEQ